MIVNSIDAAAGRGSGQVKMQTRSGGNNYHGALFYSNRNSALASQGWFQNLVGWNGLAVPRDIVRDAMCGHAAHTVIANSPKVRSEIRRFYGIRNWKVTVIPGGYSRGGDGASDGDQRAERGEAVLGLS